MQMFLFKFLSIGNGQMHITNITRRQWRWFHYIVYVLLLFTVLGEECKDHMEKKLPQLDQKICSVPLPDFQIYYFNFAYATICIPKWTERKTITNGVPRIIKKYDKCSHCWWIGNARNCLANKMQREYFFAIQNVGCFDWRLKALDTFFGVFIHSFVRLLPQCAKQRNNAAERSEKKSHIWSLNSLHYYSHYINWMLLMFCLLVFVAVGSSGCGHNSDDSFPMTPQSTHLHNKPDAKMQEINSKIHYQP